METSLCSSRSRKALVKRGASGPLRPRRVERKADLSSSGVGLRSSSSAIGGMRVEEEAEEEEEVVVGGRLGSNRSNLSLRRVGSSLMQLAADLRTCLLDGLCSDDGGDGGEVRSGKERKEVAVACEKGYG